MVTAMETTLLLSVCVSFYITVVEGAAHIEVRPNPGIIYHNAPVGVPVLAVKAFDDVTGDPLNDVTLTTTQDANYFVLSQQPTVLSEYALKVKKAIDKPVGFVFSFNVYARYNGTLPDRRIRINVTEYNQYAPSFDATEYTFSALRDGFGANLYDVGTVHATDPDAESYNRIFQYFIMDAKAGQYFVVDPSTGDLELVDTLPPDVRNMTFNVTAIDAGSPQRLNSTRVTVTITDLKPPDVFCVAVDTEAARICWKDPTNGSYVMKYELLLQVNGENATKVPVDVKGYQDETCSIIKGDQLGKNYTFTVRVLNGLEWSPDSLQRKVKIERSGLYGDCPAFSNCSTLEPCRNSGECLINPDNSYMCNCTRGWGGVNCSDEDRCQSGSNPCRNGGACSFTGNRTVDCACPPSYYGKYCLHYNTCLSNLCQNEAECLIVNGSSYSCKCGDNYVGRYCETRAPCAPSPCMRGNCTEYGHLFECTCPRGYFGKLCDHQDICELNKPCLSGTCYLSGDLDSNSYGDLYSCTCNPGYQGTNCEHLNMCEYTASRGEILCRHNGTCTFKVGSSYKCVCTGGYWGGECQHYDPCHDAPCLNNGRCHNSTHEEYYCVCGEGYVGSHCEHSYIDPCTAMPCHPESLACNRVSDTEFTCECPAERYGELCEKVNGCHGNPCHSNAGCRNTSDIGGIECVCTAGFHGSNCSHNNPCILLPCQNGGTCMLKNSNSLEFVCACAAGYHGDVCQISDPCVDSPCWNNGTCISRSHDVTQYSCSCMDLFYGDHCENVDFCRLGNHPCQNGGTCNVTEGQVAYDVILNIEKNRHVDATAANRQACLCHDDFVGDYCEKVSPCTRRPCGQGQCLARGEGHICQCPDETTRLHCDDVFCREDNNFYDKTGRYTWPRTKVAELARVRCRHGVKNRPNIEGVAIRRCSVNIDGDAFWDYPDTSDCKELSASDVSGNLKSLASLTDDASGLQPDEIANITSTLEEYFFFSFSNQDIATEMTMVVGNLLDANESVIIESNSRNHSSDRLLWLLDEYVSKVNTTSNVTIETENINLRVVNYTSPDTSFSYSPLLLDNNRTTKGGVTLTIPPEALETSGAADSNPRIQLMAFRSSSLFIPEQDVPPQDVVLKQWVVTAVINRRNISNLTTPVEINIQNIEEGGNHTCVYWDVDNHVWSNVGVVTKRQTSGHTKCLSYHLTSFAVLLDPSSDTALSSKHETILTYISYIGCGISIFGLILTLISYSMFRCLNREKSGKILMNLCLSMLIMNVVFVLGSEASLSNNGDAICKSVAILLHYFLLSTLTWMLVEAINMYQALITVFAKYSGFFMLKRCAFAWGLPALIVIVTLAVNLDNYKTTTELCFLSQGNSVAFFAALLGPACLILLINTIVFIMVSRVILRPRFKGQVGTSGGDSINPAQIRGAFTVMTLLGITWVFGPLAINEAKLVVNYIFTILNSLQGFLIFIFRCCFNPEVRMSWVLLIKTGKFKRRKGPLSAFTSDTNSKSEGKINGSYADTLKSNMYNNSLGRPKNGHAVDNGSKSSSDTNTKHVAKDYHTHFEDLNKYNGVHGKPGPRRPGTNEHARLYSGDADASRGEPRNGTSNRNSPGSDQERNGHHGNHGHHRHNGDHGNKHGVTTIYTGKYNDHRRRSSGYVATQDEFTRL